MLSYYTFCTCHCIIQKLDLNRCVNAVIYRSTLAGGMSVIGFTIDRRDGVVVRSSASQLVDLAFNPPCRVIQKDF